MRIEPLGDSALVVRVVEGFEADRVLDIVFRTNIQLEKMKTDGMVELTPAYGTVGVFFDPTLTSYDTLTPQIEQLLEEMESEDAGAAVGSTVEIPVCYEDDLAPDLRAVAWSAHLSVEQVVQRHSEGKYRVVCIGFAPGF